ncbi:MAG: peptide chain release factor N(5)-glutamine methyltransferase [Oligoflexia bacterium]|nr:peptide chain release factor N(5)-glutamine methyltransferase [Oligoflexia bacterium]
MQSWNIQQVLNWTTSHFDSKKISSSRLDAELLLAKTLNCKRIDLYLKFDQPLLEKDLNKFKELIKRRAHYEPIAYILGEKDFFGRNFDVGPGVLIPRPETELIIEEVLKMNLKPSAEILDVATGSGCIATTLAAEIQGAKVWAVDISKEAQKFCEQNFKKLQVQDRVEFILSDFYKYSQSCNQKFDLVVSNPPYVSTRAQLMSDVKNFEPSLALYGGEIGDEILLKWLPEMIKLCKLGGSVLCEIGFDQTQSVSEVLKDYNFIFIKDYANHNRIVRVDING